MARLRFRLMTEAIVAASLPHGPRTRVPCVPLKMSPAAEAALGHPGLRGICASCTSPRTTRSLTLIPTGTEILTDFPSPGTLTLIPSPGGRGRRAVRAARGFFHLGRGERVREVTPHPHPLSRPGRTSSLLPHPHPFSRREKGASRCPLRERFVRSERGAGRARWRATWFARRRAVRASRTLDKVGRVCGFER
jgi:hypothetical protein